MIKTREHALKVQARREKSGRVGAAGAVKGWNRRNKRDTVPYARGKAPKPRDPEEVKSRVILVEAGEE